MKCLTLLLAQLFLSSYSFAGIESVIIVAKLKSIDGQYAKIEYQGKTYHTLRQDIKNLKSAISGENVEVALSSDDFDFLLRH